QPAQLQRGFADDLDVELLLSLEVVIKQPLRDSRRGGHIVDGDVAVRAGGKQMDAELEELRAALVNLQPLPARRLAERPPRFTGHHRRQSPNASCNRRSSSTSLVLIFPSRKSRGSGVQVPDTSLMNRSAEVLSTQ